MKWLPAPDFFSSLAGGTTAVSPSAFGAIVYISIYL
jgi:hypothetical protein